MPSFASVLAVCRKYLLPATLTVLLLAGGLLLWHSGLLGVIRNKDRLISTLKADALKGPLLCVAVQFIQVVIFIIPGEITQFAAGYVFGVWRGMAYSIVGILLGAAFCFYFARVVGRPALRKIIGGSTLERMDNLLSNAEGKSALFFLFLLPGTPKDAMSYGAGLTNMRLAEFVVLSGLARSPGGRIPGTPPPSPRRVRRASAPRPPC